VPCRPQAADFLRWRIHVNNCVRVTVRFAGCGGERAVVAFDVGPADCDGLHCVDGRVFVNRSENFLDGDGSGLRVKRHWTLGVVVHALQPGRQERDVLPTKCRDAVAKFGEFLSGLNLCQEFQFKCNGELG